MVAKVFLLLLVVSASFSIGRYDDDLCREQCFNKCWSQSCKFHCDPGIYGGRQGYLLGSNRNDLCVECNNDCYNCDKECGKRNIKSQEVMVSKDSNECVEECNNFCHKSCTSNIKTIFRNGKMLILKDCDDDCKDMCSKFCDATGNVWII